MPIRITNKWPFLRNVTVAADPSTLHRVHRLHSWYQSIHDLPLKHFITCMTEDNLAALIINGTPTDAQLQDAWDKITEEYTTAIGDNEFKMYLTLHKEVTQLTVAYKLIHYAVEILEKVFYQGLADELNKLLRTSFKFNVNDPAAYARDLKMCLTRAKEFQLKLNLKSSQLRVIEERQKNKGKKPTREYFTGVLITLSDHVKYKINDDITVYEYCDRVRRLSQYVEQTKKKVRA